MTERIEYLRKESFEKKPAFSAERAKLLTDFYKANDGKYPVPVLRGMNFKYICEHKTLYIGERELIVGERGPAPKAVSSFPELTCHSLEDLEILNTRQMQSYAVFPADIEIYREHVIPYWRGRNMRDKAFGRMPQKWLDLYEAGLFTEFGEQRAFGHTSLDGTIYKKGMLDFKEEIKQSLASLDFINDPDATEKEDELTGMLHSCDASSPSGAATPLITRTNSTDRTRLTHLLKAFSSLNVFPINYSTAVVRCQP